MSLSTSAMISMAILALQNGLQPVLTKMYTQPGINRSTVILMQEVVKGILAFTLLTLTAKGNPWKDWTISSWLRVAFLPATLYAIQNIAALTANQNLDALTFNVLNQTKTLSAALCCYLLLSKKQSHIQIFALLLLLLSALVIEGIVSLDSISDIINGRSSAPIKENDSTWKSSRHWTHGVAPIALASFISGLAGALSQRSLQSSTKTTGRNAYLFSLELCVASVIFLVSSMLISPDGQQILQQGFFHKWTPSTMIPILTNCVGGIVVGLVTKYAGAVRKGFALIFGMLISGLAQQAVSNSISSGGGVSNKQIVGGLLAAVSLYLHSTNPPKKVSTSTVTSIQDKKTQ